MTELTVAAVESALAEVVDPNMGIDLVEARAVADIRVDGREAAVDIVLGYPAAGFRERLTELVEAAVRAAGAEKVTVAVDWKIESHAVQRNLTPLEGVKNIIAVASAKGGVGKSTTAVNLALALAREGARVGVLDADVYGPSQPQMLGVTGRPQVRDNRKIVPMQGHGLECMSIGFMVDTETPMVWRGPMVTQALNQLLNDTEWGELDYLIVDMPPGTGDIQLTLSQKVPVSGAMIVTTPQDISLLDARKGLQMFRKVEVNVLGIVENMATHVCSNCGHEEAIFGSGGGQSLSEQYEVPLLASLPLDIRIREETDSGRPTVVADPDGTIAQAYREMARRTTAELAVAGREYAGAFPNIEVRED